MMALFSKELGQKALAIQSFMSIFPTSRFFSASEIHIWTLVKPTDANELTKIQSHFENRDHFLAQWKDV